MKFIRVDAVIIAQLLATFSLTILFGSGNVNQAVKSDHAALHGHKQSRVA